MWTLRAQKLEIIIMPFFRFKFSDLFTVSANLEAPFNFRIAKSKYSHFSKRLSDLKFRSLDIYCDIEIISFISPSLGGTTIYCGGSLVEKIRTRVYFVIQSAVF